MRYWLSLAMLTLAGSAPALAQETAASAVPATLAARIDGRMVSHGGEGVTVQVPAGATYVGGERFNLYGVADAEIHVYAEADAQRRLTRLYWIQFESYLPGIGHAQYNYAEGNTRYDLWGAATWLRWGPQRTTTGTGRPGSDREHVVGILTRAGYTIPPEMLNVRMVQILDDPQGTGRGRRELMLIYAEDLAPTGRTYAELVQDGRMTPAWQPLEQPLVQRATAAFTIGRRQPG
jgi:hypothetical protein